MTTFALALLGLLLVAAPAKPQGDAERLAQQLLQGSPDEQRKALTSVLERTTAMPSLVLFLAAPVALEFGHLEDAGFLFYAAQVRSRGDLARFPPTGKGGDSPAVALAAVRQQIGSAINPAVMREPAAFRAAIERVQAWDVQTTESYDPGWEYAGAPTPAESRAIAEQKKREYLKPAADLVTLLSDPQYAAAFRTVQDHNLGPRDGGPAPSAADVAKAEQTGREIEAKKGIKGVFAATAPVAAPPVTTGPASPADATDAPRRVGGAVLEPKKLRDAAPQLPKGLPADVPGTVILDVTIDRQGRVTQAVVLRGHPAVDAAVIEAARQWIYAPALDNGVPVTVVHTTTIRVR